MAWPPAEPPVLAGMPGVCAGAGVVCSIESEHPP